VQLQASREKQRAAKEEKEQRELEKCTFQPAINVRSEFYARRSRGCLSEPLNERLFNEHGHRETLRTKAKELLDADVMCSYTFRPKINPNRTSSCNDNDRTPLHLRTEAIRQMKEDRVKSMQAAEDKRVECFFKPKISNKSDRIVQQKREEISRSMGASSDPSVALKALMPVEERLYAEAQRKKSPRLAPESSEATLSGDESSRKSMRSGHSTSSQKDFLTRQRLYDEARRQRMEVRALHKEAECPFKPKITDNSRHLAATNVEMLGETPEERVERLAVRDVRHREQRRMELEQRQFRDCTFKPELNPMSEVLAGRDDASVFNETRIHERLYRNGVAKVRAASQEKALGEQYSFKPQTDPASAKRFAHVKAHYSKDVDIMDSIKQERERKAEILSEQRKAKEEEKVSACTFRPEICEDYQEPDQPVVVSGLGRFFELKTMAQRKQHEQARREAKVFHHNAGKGRCYVGVTIPEPFELSKGPCHSTRSADWSMSQR